MIIIIYDDDDDLWSWQLNVMMYDNNYHDHDV